MIIKNASVFQEDGTFKTQDIYVEGDKIAESGSGDVIDATGLIAIPALRRQSRLWLIMSFLLASPPSVRLP